METVVGNLALANHQTESGAPPQKAKPQDNPVGHKEQVRPPRADPTFSDQGLLSQDDTPQIVRAPIRKGQDDSARQSIMSNNLQEGDLLLDKVSGVVAKVPQIVNVPAMGTDPIDFSELSFEACSRLIAAKSNTFEANGNLNRTNYLEPLGGPNGYSVSQTGDAIKGAAAEARLKRVLVTQERASEVQFANRKDDLTGQVSTLIDADEKILHCLPTVGYDPFPNAEEQLLFGRGEIVLTDKRIIMTYAGDKMEASGKESRFDGVAGCCLSWCQYQTVVGKYEHLAHREFVSHVAVIDVQRQLCNAATEHTDRVDLVRKAHFENEKEACVCCKSCCSCVIRCCCTCCKLACGRKKAGGSDFDYSTGINSDSKAGSSVQDLIKEYNVGTDPGSWSAWELEEIKRHGNMMEEEKREGNFARGEEWETFADELGGRSGQDCKQKYKEIKEGITLFESCRVGRYRAVTLKYWDPVDPRLAREITCFVDPEVTSLMELHSFSISAMKLVSLRPAAQTNSMGGELEILSAPTTVRDQVMKRGDSLGGQLLSNFFGGSADMHQARKAKLDSESQKCGLLFCCVNMFCCGLISCLMKTS